MRSTKVGKWKWIGRYIRSPFKLLIRARNLYVKSCSECATNVSVSSTTAYATFGLVGYPYPAISSDFSLPQSSSVNVASASRNSSVGVGRKLSSSDRDHHQPELILRQNHLQMRRAVSSSVAQRHRRVSTFGNGVFGRIDENEPYNDHHDLSAGEDIKLMGADRVFPRSRSTHAIMSTRTTAFPNH